MSSRRNETSLVVHDPNASRQRQQQRSRPSQKRRQPKQERPVEDDDFSDVSDHDYDQEAIEEEPRFKYSTAELADNSPRNTKCCIAAMCILCIIVAVVLSIVMVKVSENKNKENPTASPTAAPPSAEPGVGKFNAPATSVDERCADFATDPLMCEGFCTSFDCCDITLDKTESCFQGNRQGCLKYDRCHVLNNVVPPPPGDLDTICSPGQVASDPSKCKAACDIVECCWSDAAKSCAHDQFYPCSDYAACQHLRDGIQVTLPEVVLDDICKDADSETCTEKCDPGKCCWSEGDDNCFQKNFFTCLAYTPCEKLVIPPAGTNVTVADSILGSLCSTESINQGGQQLCSNACSEGSCCKEGASGYCFTDDPLGCLPYAVCP